MQDNLIHRISVYTTPYPQLQKNYRNMTAHLQELNNVADELATTRATILYDKLQ